MRPEPSSSTSPLPAEPAVLVFHAVHHGIVDANRACARLAECSRDDLVGRHIAEVLSLNPRELLVWLDQALARGKASEFPKACWLHATAGQRVPVHFAAVPLRVTSEPLVLLILHAVTAGCSAEVRESMRRSILEQIATGTPLNAVLETIVDFVEHQSPGARASILLLDSARRHLVLGAAPRLPDFYNQAVASVEIGPTVGSCGAAASLNQRIVVEDIASHPNWAPYRDLTRQAGLASCWSEPIRSSTGEVMGTFAIYHSVPQAPTQAELEAVAICSHLASIAIERAKHEEAVRESQQMLRMVLDNIPQGVFWKDRESRYLGCNRVVAKALGVESPEALIGKTDSCFPSLTPEQVAWFVDWDRKVMDAGKPELAIIEPATLPTGKTIWMETNKVPMFNAAGEVVGVLGTWQDITERKLAVEALRENEQKLAAIAATMPQALYVFDVREGKNIYSNREVWRDLGYSAEQRQQLGDDFMTKLLHPDDRARLGELLARWDTARDGEVLEVEYRLKDAAGNYRWFLGRDTVYQRDTHGRVQRIIGTTQDITERKRAEEALQRSERKYRDLVETSHDLIWAVDAMGRWSFVNARGAKALYGYEPHEMLGRHFTEFMTPERAASERLKFQEAAAGATFFGYETEHLRKDGSTAFLRFNAIPVFVDGRFAGVTGTATDLTERRRAEEQRRHLELQIQQAQKLESLGVLAGGIAHDFNNLLTSILGYADLALLDLPAHSPAHGFIEKAMDGARQAAELTKQMLAYSGKGRFVLEPINLSVLTEDMTRLLQVSISKKCVIRYNLLPNLPSVEADAAQMRQIIMNLIINASEAIGDSSGVIAISTGAMHCDRAYLADTCLDEQLPEGLYVYLEVADTGCGMSEETRAKVFDPFFTTKFTGRGLGLSAVMGIVRGHRGAIKCYSELGKGTTFKVLFPASPALARAPDPVAAGDDGWRGQGTVLVVDDEESIRALAREMFVQMGFDVLMAEDGRRAVELFRGDPGKIRLVLLDMTMPHLDGEETFRELRRLRGNIPTILTSGYNEQTATSRFAGKGLAGFIQKPYRFEDLRTVVRKVLGHGTGGGLPLE